jgi:hypothetical protein
MPPLADLVIEDDWSVDPNTPKRAKRHSVDYLRLDVHRCHDDEQPSSSPASPLAEGPFLSWRRAESRPEREVSQE